MRIGYKKAFTMIELLVVTAIISILALLVVMSVAGARVRSMNTTVQNDIEQLGKAIEQFAETKGNARVPASTATVDQIASTSGRTLAVVMMVAPDLTISRVIYAYSSNTPGYMDTTTVPGFDSDNPSYGGTWIGSRSGSTISRSVTGGRWNELFGKGGIVGTTYAVIVKNTPKDGNGYGYITDTLGQYYCVAGEVSQIPALGITPTAVAVVNGQQRQLAASAPVYTPITSSTTPGCQ
jgi:prepilin-type N-terminal cleavage/methylation domain-containing protein